MGRVNYTVIAEEEEQKLRTQNTMIDELRLLKRLQLKSGQAREEEDITEMAEALDEDYAIYETENVPENKYEFHLVKLPKKPKATKCTEYRTLSLTTHIENIAKDYTTQGKTRKINGT